MTNKKAFLMFRFLFLGALLAAGCAAQLATPAVSPQIPTCSDCEILVNPNVSTTAMGTINMVRPYSAAKLFITPAINQPEVPYTLSTIPISGQQFVYASPRPLPVLSARVFRARMCLYYVYGSSVVCDQVTLNPQ